MNRNDRGSHWLQLRKTVTTTHKWITRVSPLWAGKRRWTRSFGQYRRVIGCKRREQAIAAVKEATNAWMMKNSVIGDAMVTVSWETVNRIVGISTYEHQHYYRLKLRRLTRWNQQSPSLDCLHIGCHDTSSSLSHIFWVCQSAQQMWSSFLVRWRRVDGGVEIGTQAEIFSLRLDLPPENLLLRVKR
ncbi:reverse transcriptase [Phytophthora megakarya]|uniref:Reverse transcriptase n=1 Tax=Phytophthora megakarya TaxID=4795 RepID=A0A225VAV4_9STRA|nr:reverse transcriptase [Phytophthora megakarya]